LFLSRYSKDCEKFPYDYNLQQLLTLRGMYEQNQRNEPGTDGSTVVAFELTTEKKWLRK
jgi:hypothetical protein